MARQVLVTPVGRLVYGNIITPRENPNNGKLEWAMGMIFTDEESVPMLEAVEACADAKCKEDPKFPEVGYKVPYKQSVKTGEDGKKAVVEGELLFNFKRNYHYKSRTGETAANTPPHLYDSQGRVVTGSLQQIPYGTTGKVIYEAYAYSLKALQGVQFQLKGFQIAELGEEQAPDLAPIEGGFVLDAPDAEFEALLAGDA